MKSNTYKYVLIFAIGDYFMETKNITLKVKSELYNAYRKFCKEKGWIVSRQFEIMMETQMVEEGG